MNKPRIAITMGDPAGVGPEICLQALNNPELAAECVPIVFGDAAVLQRVAEECALPMVDSIIDDGAELSEVTEPTIYDLRVINASDVVPGRVSAATGAAAYYYIEEAIAQALSGNVAAVSTY